VEKFILVIGEEYFVDSHELEIERTTDISQAKILENYEVAAELRIELLRGSKFGLIEVQQMLSDEEMKKILGLAALPLQEYVEGLPALKILAARILAKQNSCIIALDELTERNKPDIAARLQKYGFTSKMNNF
jgi:hypothetical protein